jgi:hypothetical protein
MQYLAKTLLKNVIAYELLACVVAFGPVPNALAGSAESSQNDLV